MIYMVLMYTNSEPTKKAQLDSPTIIIFCAVEMVARPSPVYYLSQKLMLKNKNVT